MLWLVATALAAPWNVDSEGVVLGGWDPVSYHEGQPALGQSEHALEWDGATWYFRSPTSAARFEQHPERFAPALGGWCAFGFAMDPANSGWQVGPYPVDPRHYVVEDGHLLLFYDSSDFHGRERWRGDTSALMQRALQAWSQWSAGRGAVRVQPSKPTPPVEGR